MSLEGEDQQEPGLPDEFHGLQPRWLSATLRLPDFSEAQIFTETDFNLYYDPDHTTWYKRPDWFAVAGVTRLYDGVDMRSSYVIWDEQVIPFIVVELISPGTAMSDLGELKREHNGTPTKWQVYEQIIKVPNYVVFDRYKDKLWSFKLIDGQYQEQDLNDTRRTTEGDRRYWLEEMGIGLGVWEGEYEGVTRPWLRWYDADGRWIPNKDERIEQERSRAEQERARAEQERARAEQERARAEQERLKAEQELQQRQEAEHIAEQERSRAERLAKRLKELGIDPDEELG